MAFCLFENTYRVLKRMIVFRVFKNRHKLWFIVKFTFVNFLEKENRETLGTRLGGRNVAKRSSDPRVAYPGVNYYEVKIQIR